MEAAEISDKLVAIKQRLEQHQPHNLETVFAQLNTLYEGARTEAEQQAITAVWHDAQAMQASTTNAIGMAADAMEIANSERNLREAIAEEYEALETAVENRDCDHDLVGDLIDEVQNDHEHWFLESQLEESLTRLCHAIMEDPDALIPAPMRRAAQRFYTWLVEPNDEADELTDEQRQILVDLIQSFVLDEDLIDE